MIFVDWPSLWVGMVIGFFIGLAAMALILRGGDGRA